jgi:hypothetical protein
MKLHLTCMECQIERGIPSFEFAETELNNKGYYEWTCSKGHKNITLLQNAKFEILFEMGANAILDGYYRDAISSFTASLERFYEFCIELFAYNRKIDEIIYENTWKLISDQSERQFGAFCFLYMLEFNEQVIDTKIDEKLRKIRNRVIHKGYIPTKEEAIEYGEIIFNFINSKIEKIKKKYSETINVLIGKRLKEITKNIPKNKPRSTMCITTILSLTYEEPKRFENKTFLDILNSLQEQNNLVDSALNSPYMEVAQKLSDHIAIKKIT